MFSNPVIGIVAPRHQVIRLQNVQLGDNRLKCYPGNIAAIWHLAKDVLLAVVETNNHTALFINFVCS